MNTEVQGTTTDEAKVDDRSLAPFNPASDQALTTTLRMFDLQGSDVLFDLGCGDARLLTKAALETTGLRCVGIELCPVVSNRAYKRIQDLPSDVQKRIEVRCEDAMFALESPNISHEPSLGDDEKTQTLGEFRSELTLRDDCTAMFLFILPKGIRKLAPVLQKLLEYRKNSEHKKSFRIISYMFRIPEWDPCLVDTTTKGDAPLYLYRFDLRKDATT